ncbi:hypothetical protein RRG08_019335 [Elysia crispata]|uniref:Uncharacterized protein n=1 Tax=Elysia crispata TaxID=231223 RepID=A0AAE0Z4Q5_9GAST|nr:hypothetical protein RRG08_019335 [Elysia crispata]
MSPRCQESWRSRNYSLQIAKSLTVKTCSGREASLDGVAGRPGLCPAYFILDRELVEGFDRKFAKIGVYICYWWTRDIRSPGTDQPVSV